MTEAAQQSEADTREVLVVNRNDIFKGNCNHFTGFVSADMFNLGEAKEKCFFLNKKQAEMDRRYKQIIPYTLILCPNGDKILMYSRGKEGDENRLHDKFSIGIGGHIEPCDVSGSLQESQFSWVIQRCLRREITEELHIPNLHDLQIPELVGYVNEDYTDVGSVHFGMVFVLKINAEQMQGTHAKCSSIHSVNFLTGEKMALDNYDSQKAVDLNELWTNFVIGALRSSRNRILYATNKI